MAFDYLHLVAQLYDLLLDGDWEAALAPLTQALGSEGCYLLLVDPSRSVVLGSAGYNLPPDAMREYETEMSSICPRIAYADSVRDFGVMYDDLHTPEHEMGRDPFYSWIMSRGLKYYLNIQAVSQPNMLGALAFQRTAKQGHVTPADIDLAWKLGPHVRRIMQAQAVLGDAKLRSQAAEQALDQLRVGVVFVDTAANILHMSRPAEEMLRETDGLKTVGRRLAADLADEDKALRTAIGRSVGRQQLQGSGEMASTLSISRPSQSRPYQVMVCPIGPRGSVFATIRPAAVIFLVDPERAPANMAHILQRLHGLTEAEAAMAADLVAGLSLAEHADVRSLTMNTARWRLKQLQAKTDTNSQLALMRVLMAGLAGLVEQSEPRQN